MFNIICKIKSPPNLNDLQQWCSSLFLSEPHGQCPVYPYRPDLAGGPDQVLEVGTAVQGEVGDSLALMQPFRGKELDRAPWEGRERGGKGGRAGSDPDPDAAGRGCGPASTGCIVWIWEFGREKDGHINVHHSPAIKFLGP